MNTKGLETNTQKMNRLEAENAVLRGDLSKWVATCDESRLGIVLPMPPLVQALLKEVERLKAENARLAAALPLLKEVIYAHSNPDCADYNKCDSEPCRWCVIAKDINDSGQAALRDLLAPTIEAVSLAEQWMARPKHGMPDRQAIALTLKNELVRLSKYTHRTL